MRSKKAIYNLITNLFLEITTLVYGFVVPRIIIGYYGSDVNGLITSITQFLAYISLFESGFGPVVRATLYKPIAKKDDVAVAGILKTAEKFFRRIAGIFVFYIVLLSIVFPFIAKNDFNTLFTVSMVIVIGISTFAEYFFGMTYKLYLRAKQKTYIISIVQMVTYILSIIAVVSMAVFGVNVVLIKLITGLIFTIRPIVLNIYVKKKYKIDLKNVSDGYPIKQKWDGLAQHVASVIHGHTDVAVLTFFADLGEVSVYSVYYLIVKGLRSLVQVFASGMDAFFGDMIAKQETDNLNKKFAAYEVLCNTISTILFTCAIVLATPFVSVYMSGVNDIDYIRPLFGVLIVVSEYVNSIRMPYSNLTYAAGHFKETRVGAWVECGVNVGLSVMLVWRYGLVGVAIGTIVAISIRTVEFVYHTNKYILGRSMMESIEKISLAVVETLAIVLISHFLPFVENVGYLNLFINAVMVFILASAIVLVVNCLVFREESRTIVKTLSNIKRGKAKQHGAKE